MYKNYVIIKKIMLNNILYNLMKSKFLIKLLMEMKVNVKD